jgi:hypothetical protein
VAEGLSAMLGNHRPAATEGHAMTNVGPVGVGVIGAGMISEFYLENLTRFPDTNVLAIADIDLARAQSSRSMEPRGRSFFPIPTGSMERSASLARWRNSSGPFSSNGKPSNRLALRLDAVWAFSTWRATFVPEDPI